MRDINIFRALQEKTKRDYILNMKKNIWYMENKKEMEDFQYIKETHKNIFEKIPVLRMDPKTLKKELDQNYFFKDNLHLYTKKGLILPFIIKTFPIKGIPGSYTLSENERQLIIDKNEEFLNSLTYQKMRYLQIMYGGQPIRNEEDILYRIQSLLQKDPNRNLFAYPKDHIHGNKSCFPLIQHFLAFDTYNLYLPINPQLYSEHFIFDTKYLAPSKILELQSIAMSHKFLFRKYEYQLLVIDERIPQHKKLCSDNMELFAEIIKQKIPEVVCYAKTSKNIFIPIDTKLIGETEYKLPLLNSYSSVSPHLQNMQYVDRMIGSISVLVKKNIPENQKIYLNLYKTELGYLKKEFIAGRITENTFMEGLEILNVKFFKENIHMKPSFIADALNISKQNDVMSEYMQKKPKEFQNMFNDIKTNFTYDKIFPTSKSMIVFNPYEYQLKIMLLLKENDPLMLQNYYTLRLLMLIKDLDNVI